jgi:dTDP-4-dehydrorhamnose 3,5-epimerase-like enzyme
MKSTVEDSFLIDFPKISDPDGKGNLSVIERDILPYSIKRVYYLYDVPSDSTRGGHAHIQLNQCLIALSGSFEVVLDDGENQKKIQLNKPNIGLMIPNGIWREIENFSSGSVCLALVSDVYKEEDYIRDYEEFRVYKASH